MGQLPSFRTSANQPAFWTTAVDFFGPLKTKLRRGVVKDAHVALFTCTVTRAIHLEFCFDLEGGQGLSAEKFLMAVKRFASIRGIHPMKFYSDQGPNLVGASKTVKKILKDRDLTLMENGLRGPCNFMWEWNCPTASHQNGVVESFVKTVRKALDAIADYHNKSLSPDEWITILAEITYLVNSRPLFPKSSGDLLDMAQMVTPNSLLHGQNMTIPQPKNTEHPKDRMDIIQRRIQTFWDYWQANMPRNLLCRSKWFYPNNNLTVGDLVLERKSRGSATTPRAIWPLAEVIATQPGQDGLVRKVRIKTKEGQYDRPISKLVLVATAEEIRAKEVKGAEEDLQTL